MVSNVIETMNGLAKEKHEEEHRLALEKEEGKGIKLIFFSNEK